MMIALWEDRMPAAASAASTSVSESPPSANPPIRRKSRLERPSQNLPEPPPRIVSIAEHSFVRPPIMRSRAVRAPSGSYSSPLFPMLVYLSSKSAWMFHQFTRPRYRIQPIFGALARIVHVTVHLYAVASGFRTAGAAAHPCRCGAQSELAAERCGELRRRTGHIDRAHHER